MIHRTIHRQAGFSIISLMIASAIGLFLIGGAGKIYLDSKDAFTARSAAATAAESSRFALQDLRRYLVMAGRGIIEQDDSPDAYSATDNNLRTYPAVDPDNSVASATTGIIDQDIDGNSAVAVRYAVGPPPCGEGDRIDTGSAEDQIANQYLTATEVDNAGLWISVVSIRIGLVISSDTQELPNAYQPHDVERMNVLGMEVFAPDTSHAYKAVNATISLRNLNSIGMSRQ
ncbi:MAG: PilW family protein [Candidatus Thiodiazotropha endolucinida]